MPHPSRPLPPARRCSLADVGERLRTQYARHQRSASFWNAYQAIQDELAESFPGQRVELCNLMAEIAQRLGAVEQAQLVDTPPL
ncbi:hypothetical protein [Stenotrophomonas sp. YIM B06876]|uniref:hypothetical protein n=1 Tax=Stenotrophomonas sp. YIM B06876 TaxID=3060211 RepID=UPI002738D521|nr:hypothetical protein [Stenotrophomonas sp. YIM B06876]